MRTRDAQVPTPLAHHSVRATPRPSETFPSMRNPCHSRENVGASHERQPRDSHPHRDVPPLVARSEASTRAVFPLGTFPRSEPSTSDRGPGPLRSEPSSLRQGETGKMSASDPNSAIYVTDSPKDIKNKINKYAFSGGQDSIENHRKLGANLEVDIPIKYLGFFLEDDSELQDIKKEYGAGRLLIGEVKKHLVEVLSELVERHCRARAAVTEEMVDVFMAVRPLPNMF